MIEPNQIIVGNVYDYTDRGEYRVLVTRLLGRLPGDRIEYSKLLPDGGKQRNATSVGAFCGFASVVGNVPAPTPRDPHPDETIPGDRDADFPVTKKDIMTVFIPFAVAAVAAYVVARIIWK